MALSVTCTACQKQVATKKTARGNLRVAQGWKRVDAETLLCPACRAKRLRLRAVTFPVATVIGAEWKEFTDALRVCWARSTELANWAVRQLLLADSERRAGDAKLAKAPKYELYRKWQDFHDRAAWSGAAQSANCLLRAVEQKFRKKRYALLWLNSEAPPRAKYPQPYPVHNASWKAEYHETVGETGQVMKVPVVSVVLDGTRFVLKLRSGFTRSRQLKAFAQLASGEALRGELAIYRQRSFSAHRRTDGTSRIMVKMVAHLPAPLTERTARGVFEVRTGRKALLVGMAPGRDKPWLYHSFWLKQAIYNYDSKRQRLADDLKAERRPASQRELAWLRDAAMKMNRQIDSGCRLMARMITQYAVRQGLAEVAYDDSERRYFSRFDWGKLARYLSEACESADVKLTRAEVVETETSLNPEATE